MAGLHKFTVITKDTSALTCSAANSNTFDIPYQLQVKRLLCIVDTIMSSTGAVVVTFYKRPTYGTTSGQSAIGTVTMASTAAVGQIYYKDVESAVVPEGYQIAAVVTTTATTSGKCLTNFIADESPDCPANNTLMNSSA